MVPKGLLIFLGFLGNVEFSPLKRLLEVMKKFASVFVTASAAMDFCLPIVLCEMTRTKWSCFLEHIGSTQAHGGPGL